MIKNIVFDLGNVLISFRPAEFLEKKKYPENIITSILSDIFESNEWTLLDKGEISTQEAIDVISIKSSLRKDEITHIFNLRSEVMFPLTGNVRLLPELKKQGFMLYFLSNFPFDLFQEIKSKYSFFKYFDGGIISSEVKLAKPDSRIYRHFLDEYSLIAGECLFIDDLEINVNAAQLIGMKGIATNGSTNISKEMEIVLNHPPG